MEESPFIPAFWANPAESRSLRPSFFLFSLPKAGSVLLEAVAADLCALAGIKVVSPTVQMFERGLDVGELEITPDQLFEPVGYCYSGFREFPPFLSESFLAGRKAVLLIRDPRDVLTSMYYSIAYSHPLPGPGKVREQFLERRAEVQRKTIDDFVLSERPALEHLLNAFISGLGQTELRLYRYEDIIDRKPEWLRDLAEFLEIEAAPEELDAIAVRHDLRPSQGECPDQHVRQVAPGDHRRKLRYRTILRLNAELSPQWQKFGYLGERPGHALFLPAQTLQLMPKIISVEARVDVWEISGADLSVARSNFSPCLASARLNPAKGAEILGLWMENQRRQPLTVAVVNQKITIVYLVRILDAVDGMIFGIRIADADGKVLLTVNTAMLDIAIGAMLPGAMFQVCWHTTAPTLPGEYRVSCGCSLEESPMSFLARHVDAYRLRIIKA